MSKVTHISSRKLDHIRINLENDVHSERSTGLENYRFIHRAVPELNLDDIDISLSILGRDLNAPLIISSMTGGVKEAEKINRTLAQAAQETKIAMGIGSQRAALEQPNLVNTFQIRNEAPDALIFANLGAVQLNYGFGLEECQKAVDMVEADALILHFNPLQEALQPDGQTRFAGLLKRIDKLCKELPVPVIAKEVGWGFSETDIKALTQVGINIFDVAGAGGTSWSKVEMYRAQTENQAHLAAAFSDWGISTAEAILNVKSVNPDLLIFASGGIQTGVDIAKSISLGAKMGGMASPFLKKANLGLMEMVEFIMQIQQELRVCMFVAGIGDLNTLTRVKLDS